MPGPPSYKRPVSAEELVRWITPHSLAIIVGYAREQFEQETRDYQEAEVGLRNILKRVGSYLDTLLPEHSAHRSDHVLPDETR